VAQLVSPDDRAAQRLRVEGWHSASLRNKLKNRDHQLACLGSWRKKVGPQPASPGSPRWVRQEQPFSSTSGAPGMFTAGSGSPGHQRIATSRKEPAHVRNELRIG